MDEEIKEDKITHKATFNEKGEVILKKKSKIAQGKQSRAVGLRFESKVREYWEGQGWSMDKWSNNVDLEKNKVAPAKRKYNPFKKSDGHWYWISGLYWN